MSYIVKSTEKTKGIAAEHETKALLYLMGCRDDSGQVNYFVVDFLNDISGMDKFLQSIWDIQSKAQKDNSPKSLGKEMVTLFKNYMYKDAFPFAEFILFVGGVSNTTRKDDDIFEFGIENLTSNALKKVKEGLISACKEKRYIDQSAITDLNIDGFLSKVKIHISELSKAEYIKKIISSSIIKLPEDFIIEAIFDEIKKEQSNKKDINTEGLILNRLDEILPYNKHLQKNQILLLILNRVVNTDFMTKSLPLFFLPVINSFPEIDRKAKKEDCQNAIACVLHDTNNSNNIWLLYENIYEVLVNNPNSNIYEISDLVDKELAAKLSSLDDTSLKYLIAVVKEGLYDN